MWLLWLICALLVIIALALLIQPLFKHYSDRELERNQTQADQRKELNIKLYEEKKVQIELDFANGLLDEEARIQAQNEIEHSLINDAAGFAPAQLVQLNNVNAKKLAISLLVFIPVFASIVYSLIKPDNVEQIVFAQPVSNNHTQGNAKQVPDISSMVASLEQKLQQDSNNAQGWNMLGRSYVVLKRYPDAVHAYEKALKIVQQDSSQQLPELEINYVEALMQTGDKGAYQKARERLNTMLSTNADNGDALWFMGFLDYESGDKQAAVKRWSYLLALLPADNEQAKIVNVYLSHVKKEISGGSDKVAPAPGSATKKDTVKKPAGGPAPGQQLTGSKQEQKFIASMVARVEKRVQDNPQDVKGWKTLGKSYGVLNRSLDSAHAYAKAAALDSQDAQLLMNYFNAVVKAADANELDNARIFFAQLVDQNPQHLDALFLSGSLARVAGDKQEAKKFWNLLLPQLTTDSAAYENVLKNIKAL